MRFVNVTRHGSSEQFIVKEHVTHVEQVGTTKRSVVYLVGGSHVEVAMSPGEFAERCGAAVD